MIGQNSGANDEKHNRECLCGVVSWGMQGAFQFFGMCQCSLCCKILRSALAQMRLSLLKISVGAQLPIMWDITTDRHPVSLKLPSAKPAACALRTFISEENWSKLFWAAR